ncbi:hypothetical protein ACC690_39785, partial [Rhizobium johnstonii]|uniref:hypothetical protein n=1 Tax=Rhizobium johnstonii TaxID=3019933 RepID=UPI003F9DE8DB
IFSECVNGEASIFASQDAARNWTKNLSRAAVIFGGPSVCITAPERRRKSTWRMFERLQAIANT